MAKKESKSHESQGTKQLSFTPSSNLESLDLPHKTIRLAVSGDVVLTKLETQLIDTVEFQRLRKLKQLGTSHLVYPSANHTRFEHSLGVLKMAEFMMRSIRDNVHNDSRQREVSPHERRMVRLTALLHDIGNLPFGHTLEDETRVIASGQEETGRLERFMGQGTDLGDILLSHLGIQAHTDLLRILSAKADPIPPKERMSGAGYVSDLKENAFIADIVKNTVCADLLDYVKRDAYFCELPLGVPDRFLRYLFIHEDSDGTRRLAIRLWKAKDAAPRVALVSELVQLLETRYFLAERVYFHHAKQISSAMVASAVWHAMNQQKRSLTLEELLEYGDDELLGKLQNEERFPVASRIANAVARRELFDEVYSLSRDKADPDKFQIHDRLQTIVDDYHKDAANRADVELQLCERADLNPGDIVIYCPDDRMNLKVAWMKVTSKGGILPFQVAADNLTKDKMNAIIASHKQLWELKVFVRGGDQLESSAIECIKAWCAAQFEEQESGSLVELAARLTMNEELRKSGAKLAQPERDAVVEEVLAAKHKGEISRAAIKELLESRI